MTRYEVRDGAAWITLDQPERRNTLTAEVLASLAEHLRAGLDDERVRSMVLTGAGTVFCAGADLKGDRPRGGAERHPLAVVLELLWNGPKPVVAAVNGSAFGGGVGLVAAADVAIAVEGAEFAFSEVRLGVAPALIAVVVVPKIGVGHARRLFLTGERFGAEQALRYGLVDEVVAAAELEAAAHRVTEALGLGAPGALYEARRLAAAGAGSREEFARAEETSIRLFNAPEADEGFAAFREKRSPSWAVDDAGPGRRPREGGQGKP
jgi:methylglutaconyl-CoA hydratase